MTSDDGPLVQSGGEQWVTTRRVKIPPGVTIEAALLDELTDEQVAALKPGVYRR